jgi:hypothetical protein
MLSLVTLVTIWMKLSGKEKEGISDGRSELKPDLSLLIDTPNKVKRNVSGSPLKLDLITA